MSSAGRAALRDDPVIAAELLHHAAAVNEEADFKTPDLARAQRDTVMVVEAEPAVRKLITEGLDDLGYAAIEAENGPSGLKILQSKAHIDLVIIDVGLLLGMNGR